MPVHIVRASHLKSGKHEEFKEKSFVQLSKRCDYKELKRRLADVVRNLYEDLKEENSFEIRIWQVENFDKLKTSLKEVAKVALLPAAVED